MQIGEVIRKYRKAADMTQEEMANRLGVTAPAVNKWENGNSLPDIMLLAPIARLLQVSLDELLAFREELTQEEINGLVQEAEKRGKEESYEEVFQWAKKQLELYPNCEQLMLYMTVELDGMRLMKAVPDSEKYNAYIIGCYNRALSSKEETVRRMAADMLFHFYLREEEYEKAEECLAYLSDQNPEKKRRQADIYWKKGQTDEAYRAYEELLFSVYQSVSAVFNSMCALAIEEKKWERAHYFAEKQKNFTRLFEMGEYREYSLWLEVAATEKDADKTIEVMEKMLESAEGLYDFRDAPLYAHMKFKEVNEVFQEEMKENLIKAFQDEEAFGFLKEDERWSELTK